MDRTRALEQLHATLGAGRPIIGGGAGTGLSAKSAEGGGIDLIIVCTSGRYRMAGRDSLASLLPYGDANAIVVAMANDVLPVIRDTPVLAGVCGTDPFRLMGQFLDELKRIGFTGVQNFPTVGLYDGTFREYIEEAGMGYGLEVDMIRAAHDRDLLTAPFVFDTDQATGMAKAGADILVPHLGLHRSGPSSEQTTITIEESARRLQNMHDAAKRVNPDILVMCHGGPIDEPEDAEYILQHTEGVVGFLATSSMEGPPTEHAIRSQAQRFKAINIGASTKRKLGTDSHQGTRQTA